MPWIIGETGFLAQNSWNYPEVDGTLLQQENYAEETLDLVAIMQNLFTMLLRILLLNHQASYPNLIIISIHTIINNIIKIQKL